MRHLFLFGLLASLSSSALGLTCDPLESNSETKYRITQVLDRLDYWKNSNEQNRTVVNINTSDLPCKPVPDCGVKSCVLYNGRETCVGNGRFSWADQSLDYAFDISDDEFYFGDVYVDGEYTINLFKERPERLWKHWADYNASGLSCSAVPKQATSSAAPTAKAAESTTAPPAPPRTVAPSTAVVTRDGAVSTVIRSVLPAIRSPAPGTNTGGTNTGSGSNAAAGNGGGSGAVSLKAKGGMLAGLLGAAVGGLVVL